MIVALDIETIGNPEAVAMMPDPDVKLGNTKDPAKIAEKLAEAKAAQSDKAAIDPLTARVATYAVVDTDGNEYVESIAAINDAGERALIQSIFSVLSNDGVRLVTYNGIGFDLPMIYKRALILGVSPANHGAPPITAWTKRYSNDIHFDLMQIWTGWQGFAKLDTIAGIVLGAKKIEFDVTMIADMLATDEGRKKVEDYCLQDTRLTINLWQRMNGVLFS